MYMLTVIMDSWALLVCLNIPPIEKPQLYVFSIYRQWRHACEPPEPMIVVHLKVFDFDNL